MSVREYLLLNVQAPLVSFGGNTVDNYGVTRRFPVASMLTGILANAMGWNRTDFEKHQQLQSALGYAYRINHTEPYRLIDFQTAELSASDKHWTTNGTPSDRKGGEMKGPHLRFRHYLQDVQANVALTVAESNTGLSVNQLAKAIQEPARTLFLGRKSCLPSVPLYAGITEAESAMEALCKLPIPDNAVTTDCWWTSGEGLVAFDEPSVSELEVCAFRDWKNSQHTGQISLYHSKVERTWFEREAS